MSAIDPSWPYTKAKTAVLAAAAGVIRSQGPRSATLKNIAARAEITEPAIFRHFDGVDGLFEGLFNVYERFYFRIIELYQQEQADLSGYFSVLRQAVAFLGSIGDFTYLITYADQVFSSYEELKERTRKLKRLDAEANFAFLEKVFAAGEVKPGIKPETVAFCAMGVILMSIEVWLDAGSGYDLAANVGPRLDDIEALFRA